MSYEIRKENQARNVKTETLDTRDGNDDKFVVSKDPFSSNPETQKDDQLGMEFLIPEQEQEVDEEDDQEEVDDQEPDLFDEYPEETRNPGPQAPEMTYEQIQQKKSFYLSQLKRMENRGMPVSRRYGMEHSLEQIQGEVMRLKKEVQIDAGVDYCRQGLMFCVSTIEMADGKFKLGGDLGGWSQAVMGNIDSYDEVFEELYEKYFSNSTVSPEIKLISMLAGSAFMFSLQKKMMNGQGFAQHQREMEGPSDNVDDLLRQLNDEVDIDDVSSVSSVASSEPQLVQETKKIPIKRRGRPKKN